jgi:hypothetical protein
VERKEEKMVFTLVFFKRVDKKVVKTFKTFEAAHAYAAKKHLCQYDIDGYTYIVL